MSFLALNDDEDSALMAALSFLDTDSSAESQGGAFTIESSLGDDIRQCPILHSSSFRDPDTSLLPASSSDESLQQDKSSSTARRKTSTSTLQQRRQKQEILTLRDQVLELEAYVAYLKRVQATHAMAAGLSPSGDSSSSFKTGNSIWQQLAILEARERQRSELLNRKLKSILSKQQKMNSAIRAIVGKRSVHQDMEFISKLEPAYCRPPPPDPRAIVMAQLQAQVEAIYLGSNPIPSSATVNTPSCTTHFTRNRDQGPCIEVVTTTPVAFSVQTAASVLWNNFAQKHEYPDKSYRSIQRAGDSSLETDCVATLRGASRSLSLRGLSVTRMFIEDDRIVLIMSTVMLLPTDGLRFHDSGRMTISPSGTGNDSACVIETRYQVCAETDSTASLMVTEDLSSTRDFVLHKLAAMARLWQQRFQSVVGANSSKQCRSQHSAP